jgi:hypothetical protein
MLELTSSQIEEMRTVSHEEPLRITNPQTNETFVLLRDDEYKRLKAEEDKIDYSPWTQEERNAITLPTLEKLGWKEWNDSDFVGGSK